MSFYFAGSCQQAVVHPRQEDGSRLRRGEDQGLRHGQVLEGSPLQLDYMMFADTRTYYCCNAFNPLTYYESAFFDQRLRKLFFP